MNTNDDRAKIKRFRHAYLIMAHTDEEQLLRLLRALDDPRNDIYLHLDAKWNVEPADFRECVRQSDLYFIDRIHPAWGGSRLIRVTEELICAAYNNGPYSYYHLLSGQDMPVKTQDYIHDFFDNYRDECFLQAPSKDEIDTTHPRFAMRYEQYHLLQDVLIGKKRNVWKYLEFGFCYLQKFIGIRRFKNVEIHVAWEWFSLPESAIRYLAEHRDAIVRRWRLTYCCDELFVPTELAEAGFADKFMDSVRIRYAKWEWQGFRDYSPKYLTDEELGKLNDPMILFARKFRNPESEALYSQLKTPGSISRTNAGTPRG